MEHTDIIDTDNNNNDNNNNNSNNNKKTFEKNKKKNYIDERKDVLARLYQIIGITDTNKEFYSNSFDNEEIANQIYSLEPDILLYFNVSTWPAFKKSIPVLEKRPLSIVKSLLKDMNIEITSMNIRIKKVPKEPPINITQYKIS